jgi:hypothetical protein
MAVVALLGILLNTFLFFSPRTTRLRKCAYIVVSDTFGKGVLMGTQKSTNFQHYERSNHADDGI